VGVLTDSTIASSSVARKRFEPLCCFFAGWLLRGVGDARLAPVLELPRCWPKKLTVFDDDATGGGLEDIVQPNQGSTMVRDDDDDAIKRALLVSSQAKRASRGE
jgi:hypothetical protein